MQPPASIPLLERWTVYACRHFYWRCFRHALQSQVFSVPSTSPIRTPAQPCALLPSIHNPMTVNRACLKHNLPAVPEHSPEPCTHPSHTHHACLQPVIQCQQLQPLQPPPADLCSLCCRHRLQPSCLRHASWGCVGQQCRTGTQEDKQHVAFVDDSCVLPSI